MDVVSKENIERMIFLWQELRIFVIDLFTFTLFSRALMLIALIKVPWVITNVTDMIIDQEISFV